MFKRLVHPGTPSPPVRAPQRTPSTPWRRIAMHFHTGAPERILLFPEEHQQTQLVLFVTAEVPSHTPSLTAHTRTSTLTLARNKTLIAFGDVFTSLLRFPADCASHRRSPSSTRGLWMKGTIQFQCKMLWRSSSSVQDIVSPRDCQIWSPYLHPSTVTQEWQGRFQPWNKVQPLK